MADGAMEVLLSRASTGDLREPGPDGRELELIVEAGLRAPDHGKLRPWRFVAIEGDAKHRFAALCIAALQARDPEAPGAEIERMRGKLLSPPLIIALGVHVTPGLAKVPEIEQVMAVAASAMNMLNAAHALGYAGKWVTGPNAYDPAVAAGLGLAAPDRVAGFLYVGTRIDSAPAARRPDVAGHLVRWPG